MEVSVTGAQEVLAAAVAKAPLVALFCDWKSLMAMARHGAGAIVGAGAGPGSITTAESAMDDDAVRPEPPVSSTNVLLSDTRVKVNFGQTFSDESKLLPSLLNAIDPPEVLTSERFTRTPQASECPSS